MIEKSQLKKLPDSLNLCEMLFELGELYTSQDMHNSPFKVIDINTLISSYILLVLKSCNVEYELVSSPTLNIDGRNITCKTRSVKNAKSFLSFLKLNNGCKFYVYFSDIRYTYSNPFTKVIDVNGNIMTRLGLRFDMQDKI